MKLYKFLAATLALALGLVACGPDTPTNPNEKNHEFKVTASKQIISPNGADAVEFTATFDGEVVTEGVEVFDGEGKAFSLNAMTFTTEAEGDYTFNFKYTFEEKAYEYGPITIAAKNLTATTNTTYFQMGVDDVWFEIYFKGELVTFPDEDLTVMDYDTHAEVALEGIEVELDGQTVTLPKYTAEKVGTQKVYIYYKTSHTRNKPISLTAVDFAIPQRLEDEKPASTDFTKRVLFNQFTGTGCGYCPFISSALHSMKSDAEWKDTFVVAACHTYNPTSELYPYEALGIENSFGVNGHPALIGDMRFRTGNVGSWELNKKNITNYVSASLAEGAKAGLSVTVGGSESNTVIARVTVKAAENGNFRVGAWLVEDNIYGVQTNNMSGALPEGMEPGDFNYHNNVVRIADSEPASRYEGHNLGYLNAGEKVDKIFIMEIKEDPAEAAKENKDMNHKLHWVKENCRLVVFVSYEGKEGYYVTNVISNTALTESVAFDYK